MKLSAQHKEKITTDFAEMQSMEDLLAIINYAKSILYNERAIPFSIRQINYYSLSRYKTTQYRRFLLPKRSGGSRTITAPIKQLKYLQASLNLILQCLYEPHPAATGFIPGRSIVDNASRHVGKWFIYNLDLKDFFPSIDRPRVWACLQLPPFNLGNSPERRQLANRIAILCCTSMEFPLQDGTTETKNVLPQGAPTSPTITNIIARKLDQKLQSIANKYHIAYSRYADDITFSSNGDVFKRGSKVVKEIRKVIEGQNFQINQKKVRLQQQGYRQEVTGLIVNEKVNVHRKYIRQIRTWLYLWEAYGYNKFYTLFLKDYLKDEKRDKKSVDAKNIIGRKLDYLKMVKGEKDPVYNKLHHRYLKLTSNVNDFESREINYETSYILEKIYLEGFESAMEYYLNQ